MRTAFFYSLSAGMIAAALVYEIRDVPNPQFLQPSVIAREPDKSDKNSSWSQNLRSIELPVTEAPFVAPLVNSVPAASELPSDPLGTQDRVDWTNAPLNQMIQSLQIAANDPAQDSSEALANFQNWLLAHPADGAANVLQSLQGMSTNQWNLSGLMIRGLTQTDAVAGDQALLSILSYSGSYAPTVVLQAATAAGDLDAAADPALKQTLLRLIDWPAPNDTYRLSETALFSFARLAGRDSEFFGYLVQRLNPWLEDNAPPEKTAQALTILAQAAVNAPDFIQRASYFSQSPDENIRSAAEEYLTSLPWGGSPDPN
jgi:hypothetical protein